jgi:diguanylate cyclase (GGDEF)-like protein
MSDGTFDHDAQRFVLELDEAAQCHMAWTRRVLRCAVLRAVPGNDVLSDDAHGRCRFGLWWQRHHERFDDLDAASAARLVQHHRQMHDAARGICRRILAGEAGDASELDAFERAQAGFVDDLALLKTAYLAHSARIDALTGLPLRHGLEEEFQRCRTQALRHGEKMVALMLDVDHFKRVNDERGHAAGDLALRHVAMLLRSHCRAGEPVFRFGGEEFLALLQAADREAAQQAVERILQALRDFPLRMPDGHLLRLRASAGMAEVGTTEPMANALSRADQALYEAKAAGRDRWRWAGAEHRATFSCPS